jgi:periplasmic protein TonB
VVASNVARLRTSENGQTQIGIVDGQPLMVAGSIEEIAAIITGGTHQQSLAA